MTQQREQRDIGGLSRALTAVTRRMLGGNHSEAERLHSLHPHAHSSAIVDCGVYVDGAREPGHWHYPEALDFAKRKEHAFVWLGLHEPEASELADIASVFDLHELPVEDAIKAFQRPKIERYNEMVFAVLRTTRYIEHTELTEYSEVVETGAVMLFVGDNFVITVRHGAPAALHTVRQDLEDKPELLRHGPWAVAHAIYDRVVDSYVDCANAVEMDIDALEESVFSRQGQGPIQRIYQLKRELVEFRRAVLPLQRPLEAIVAGRMPEVPKEIRRYFRDVNDHLTRTVEQIQSFDELLNSILQARLAQVSVEQNEAMRKIAAYAGIAAVWTTAGGIWGMNFKFMPELNWRYSYPTVLLICLVFSIGVYRYFRKSGWL